MKIALVHDWLTGMRGGEKCLEALCQLYPEAEIFTLLHNRNSTSPEIESKRIHTSFVQHLPSAAEKYRYYLPLFPTAIERFDLSAYKLVISSSHCVAKGVLTKIETCHICYCHTPMRYVWEMSAIYFNHSRYNWVRRVLTNSMLNYLRRWDLSSTSRVDHFVANSQNVRHRIKKHYDRQADVIYPPVEIDSFTLGPERGNYYLIVSALVPYKRIDLAVEAFNQLGKRLVIVGSGPEEKRLKKMAQGKIEFVPWQGFEQLKEFYQNCKALIFPGEEDFGIVPVEAQACGKPVIAFGQGGVLETVQGIYPDRQQSNKSSNTGVFFREQAAASLIGAVKYFETLEFDRNIIRQSVLRFKAENYKEKMKEFVTRKLEIHRQTFNS